MRRLKEMTIVDATMFVMLGIIILLLLFNHGMTKENGDLREKLYSYDEESFNAGYEEGYEDGWNEGEKYVLETLGEYIDIT